jgi:hypothetical protein
MRNVLASLFALILGVSSAAADDIAVYRGSWRMALDADGATFLAPTLKAFLVVNYTTGEMVQVVYFAKNGKKALVLDDPFENTRALLPNGKNATALISGSAVKTSSVDFNFTTQLLRGTDLSLLVETTPAKRSIQRPRTLSGIYTYVAADPGDDSRLRTATMVYSLDTARTIAANNGDKTVQQVFTEITQFLTSKGYGGGDS